jgi:hypothetical protein
MFKSYILIFSAILFLGIDNYPFISLSKTFSQVQNPSIIINSQSKGISNGSSTSKNIFKLSFIISENTDNFTDEDIILYNAEIFSFSGKNNTYNAKFKILNKGVATVEVYGYSFTDSEGNFNQGSEQFTIFKD